MEGSTMQWCKSGCHLSKLSQMHVPITPQSKSNNLLEGFSRVWLYLMFNLLNNNLLDFTHQYGRSIAFEASYMGD